MDKKIIASLLMIGILAAVMGGATYAVFSDTETSVDNTMTAGTIDFSVDGENPWDSITWSDGLNDLKPCMVRYGEFNITNVGTNPMNLWKKLTIDSQDGGTLTEPECVEGGGTYSDASGVITCMVGADWYDERCNIASYTLYDMNVTIGGGPEEIIINHADQVRLDNVNGVWIYLGQLPAGESMIVNQSYHLSSWDGASEATVTNWAQGDELTFDVELYGEQVTGPGPNLATGTLKLRAKDTTTWVPKTETDDPVGILTYNREGDEFEYDFDATDLTPNTAYSLIYYADDYPGNHPGALIGTDTSDGVGSLNMNVMSVDLGIDLPDPADQNYPAGAKIWLVPSIYYDESTKSVISWNAAKDHILYEMNLIQYEDTDD
jgi:predicted ribosomally synthesized peptide with SipW-like signal peptide